MSAEIRSAVADAGWSRFLNLGDDAEPFLEHENLTLGQDGSAEFSGTLSAASGTFSGSLDAASGTFSGSLDAASGTFSGSLDAADGEFTGEVSSTLFTGTEARFGFTLEVAPLSPDDGDLGMSFFHFESATNQPEMQFIEYDASSDQWDKHSFLRAHQSGDLSINIGAPDGELHVDRNMYGNGVDNLPVAFVNVSTSAPSGSLQEGTLHIQVN